jgi:hypothetical protein
MKSAKMQKIVDRRLPHAQWRDLRSSIFKLLRALCGRVFIAHANRSETSATRGTGPMPAVAAPSVPPFVAVPPVSEYEPLVAVSPASESEPRAATIPSAVTRVMPIDELSHLLVMDATTPAFIVCECNGGQRQIDDYRQGGSQQRKTQCSQFEHGVLLV